MARRQPSDTESLQMFDIAPQEPQKPKETAKKADAEGRLTGQRQGREDSRKVLAHDLIDELSDRGITTNDGLPPSEMDRINMVDAVLACINKRGWRIHRSYIFCSSCATILGERRDAVLSRMETSLDALSEQMARQKVDGEEFRKAMES